jgi:hypothetical protein
MPRQNASHRMRLVIAILALSGCRREATDRPDAYLAPGTVGRAGYEYRLSMPELAKWYAILHELEDSSARNASFHVKFDFPADSTLDSQIRVVDGIPALKDAVRRAGLSSREYVALTAALVGAAAASTVVDTVPGSEAPKNVHPSNLAFLREHAAEVEALARPGPRAAAPHVGRAS